MSWKKFVIVYIFCMIINSFMVMHQNQLISGNDHQLKSEFSHSILSYSSHDPIIITNDTQLMSVAINGSGTESDPYILEGWLIIGTTNGISITGTTKHFIIRNCWIESDEYHNGIDLSMLHGTAQILNNTCQGGDIGISLLGCSSLIVANNTCNNNGGAGVNGHGIHLTNTNTTKILSNKCEDNERAGIFIHNNSNNNTLRWNICQYNLYGFEISYSDNNSLISNIANENNQGTYSTQTNHGIYISQSKHSIVINNSCIANNMEGIKLDDSPFATIMHNSISFSDEGIALDHSDSAIITDNVCFNNSGVPISVSYSSFSYIANNTCIDNKYGIGVSFSDNSLIADNYCKNSQYEGIWIGSGEL